MERIVITGGPCSGKTTLLELLKAQGEAVLPEIARQVIDEAQREGTQLLPWIDFDGFQLAVAQRQLAQEALHQLGRVYLDRGIIDGAAYCALKNFRIPDMVREHARGRYSKVYFLEQVPIFQNDSARKESPEEARQISEAIFQAYKSFGYDPIRIPPIGPEARLQVILGGEK